MSIRPTVETSARLTSTSYVVLGLTDREGPITPYGLKRHVDATIGHFWTFPHAALYTEPPRLVGLGLLSEVREAEGRRRRLFSITNEGRMAIRDWLATPATASTELRDAGLLQLFFMDLGSADQRRALADEQLVIHRTALAGYEEDERAERGLERSEPHALTEERWRGLTLPMGILYERAAVEFWDGVTAAARADDVDIDRRRLEDRRARVVSNEASRDDGNAAADLQGLRKPASTTS
jgi:DNA-binding PadR family transcriptional regulator